MVILFWILKSRSNSTGEAPIMVRISYLGKRVNLRIGIHAHPDLWDSRKQKLKGTNDLAKQLNAQIYSHKLKILRAYEALLKQNKPFTVHTISDWYNSKHIVTKGILEVFEEHNEKLKFKIGVQFTIATLKKYKTCKGKLERFIMHQYKRKDLPLNEFTRKTVAEFDFYLRKENKIQHNTLLKNMQFLKKILKYCRINEYITHDPFDSYVFKFKETFREVLTMKEIQLLIKHKASTQRLEAVKDVFLFQCFTGLAHADVFKLSKEHIKTGVDNQPWIHIHRTKTNDLTQVPILPVAETILKKYSGDVTCISKGKLLPVICNQPMNRALKDLCIEVGINKRIGTHCGRHSFATTVLLGHGLRIEIISKLLAHRDLKTTLIYAKLNTQVVSDELNKIKNVISDNLSEKF